MEIKEIKRTEIEDVVLVDGVWVELSYEGDAINVGGTWINTPEYNPDDLNEVRKIISSNEEIILRLNNARAQREFSRAQARKVTMPKDGIVIEIAANGDEVCIGGIWIGIAKTDPDNLEEVRKTIASDLNVQLLLTQVRNRARATT